MAEVQKLKTMGMSVWAADKGRLVDPLSLHNGDLPHLFNFNRLERLLKVIHHAGQGARPETIPTLANSHAMIAFVQKEILALPEGQTMPDFIKAHQQQLQSPETCLQALLLSLAATVSYITTRYEPQGGMAQPWFLPYAKHQVSDQDRAVVLELEKSLRQAQLPSLNLDRAEYEILYAVARAALPEEVHSTCRERLMHRPFTILKWADQRYIAETAGAQPSHSLPFGIQQRIYGVDVVKFMAAMNSPVPQQTAAQEIISPTAKALIDVFEVIDRLAEQGHQYRDAPKVPREIAAPILEMYQQRCGNTHEALGMPSDKELDSQGMPGMRKLLIPYVSELMGRAMRDHHKALPANQKTWFYDAFQRQELHGHKLSNSIAEALFNAGLAMLEDNELLQLRKKAMRTRSHPALSVGGQVKRIDSELQDRKILRVPYGGQNYGNTR